VTYYYFLAKRGYVRFRWRNSVGDDTKLSWLVSTEFLGEIVSGVLTTEAFASMEHSIFFTRGSYSSAPQILPVQLPE